MFNLEWEPDYVPAVKLGLHSCQILLSFTAWCLGIAVFRGNGARIVGNNAWTFSVCFISIPAWIYLIMAPRFARTRRFAEPHAMLAVDGLFTIIWLSAFSTQAAYNTANLCGEVCNLSKAIVGLAVIITLLFAATSFVSAYTLTYYNFHGNLPGYDSRRIRGGDSTNIDPDKSAFSMAVHDEEDYEPVSLDDREPQNSRYADAGRFGNSKAYQQVDDDDEGEDDPGRYAPPTGGPFNLNTEYISGGPSPSPVPMPYGGASHSPYNEPVRFPAGNYDRVQP